MKINFNGESSLINGFGSDELGWFDALQAEFCRFHDMDPDKSLVVGYLWQPGAARDMAPWLQAQGYRVQYYELSHKPRPDDNRTICYGLDFDDTCPRFIELRLKHAK